MTASPEIVLSGVSKFYGEVLGVNKVNLSLPTGITSLVGPNGSGKTTLMNLMAGLLRPSAGSVEIHGLSPDDPERFYPMIGYATQFDTFPRRIRGYDLVHGIISFHGYGSRETRDRTLAVLERVGLVEAARRRVAGYSKGMRQRIKLATAIAHDPHVLILDEPLNGLDPMARAEFIDLFQKLAAEGYHVVVSSHILHEVDMISDQVVMMSQGYVVAEGQIQSVRSEIREHPTTIQVRANRPERLAERLFADGSVVEARIGDDRGSVVVRTRDAELFYRALNRIVVAEELSVEAVTPTDDDVHSVYKYLVGGGAGS
jgi:ABC-2 type transport system ATP-binding protein